MFYCTYLITCANACDHKYIHDRTCVILLPIIYKILHTTLSSTHSRKPPHVRRYVRSHSHSLAPPHTHETRYCSPRLSHPEYNARTRNLVPTENRLVLLPRARALPASEGPGQQDASGLGPLFSIRPLRPAEQQSAGARSGVGGRRCAAN